MVTIEIFMLKLQIKWKLTKISQKTNKCPVFKWNKKAINSLIRRIKKIWLLKMFLLKITFYSYCIRFLEKVVFSAKPVFQSVIWNTYSLFVKIFLIKFYSLHLNIFYNTNYMEITFKCWIKKLESATV